MHSAPAAGGRAIRCWIVRHAQSTANAGAPTADPATIPLTPLGHQQAEALARWFPVEPARVVVSPFLRTEQTAAPLCRRFPRAQVEPWPIHEFTYLSPARFAGTTAHQRRRAVVEFWNIADPRRIDGPGAESLAQFFDRVERWSERLASLDTDTVIFAHGQIMQALLYLTLVGEAPTDSNAMRRFKLFSEAIEIPNTGLIEWRALPGHVRGLSAIRTPHLDPLPPSARGPGAAG